MSLLDLRFFYQSQKQNNLKYFFLSAILNSYWIPNMINIAKSFDDSIECLECLPICSKTNYQVLSSNFDLRANAQKDLQFLWVFNVRSILFLAVIFCFVSFFSRDLGNLEDISIMRVYFPYIDTTLYTADVLMTWQELLSSVHYSFNWID